MQRVKNHCCKVFERQPKEKEHYSIAYCHFYLEVCEWISNSLLMETNCQLLAKMYLFAVHLHPLGHSSNLSFIYRVYSLTDDITWSVILARHHICWWWCKSILKYSDTIFQNESSNFVLYITLVFSSSCFWCQRLHVRKVKRLMYMGKCVHYANEVREGCG